MNKTRTSDYEENELYTVKDINPKDYPQCPCKNCISLPICISIPQRNYFKNRIVEYMSKTKIYTPQSILNNLFFYIKDIYPFEIKSERVKGIKEPYDSSEGQYLMNVIVNSFTSLIKERKDCFKLFHFLNPFEFYLSSMDSYLYKTYVYTEMDILFKISGLDLYKPVKPIRQKE